MDGSKRIIFARHVQPSQRRLSESSQREARVGARLFVWLSRTCLSFKEDDPDCLSERAEKRLSEDQISGGIFRLAVGTDSTSSVPLLALRDALLLFVEQV